MGNWEPETGSFSIVTGPPQLSDAVGSGNVTAIEVTFGGTLTATFEIGSITGGVFSAVTFTVRVPVPISPPASETFNPTRLLPGAAAHPACTVALIVPSLLLVIPVTVIPAGTVVVITDKLLEALSTSETVAITETVPAAVCCRVTVIPLMVGASLTALTSIETVATFDSKVPSDTL